MIAVLGRQSVNKRVSPARLPVKARQSHQAVWPVAEGKAGKEPRKHGVWFLQGQRPARVKNRPLAALSSVPRDKAPLGADSPRIRFSVAARPLITAAFAGVLLTAFLAPAIALKAGGVPTVVLPASADAEQELYRRMVPPEETARVQGSPAQLSSLKVGSYTVRTGDTISQVAQRLKLDVGTLISFNGIRDARSLAVGTALKYPNSDGLMYLVRRGDTLDTIARSFTVSLEGILDWNQLDSSVITVGQELFIPGGHLSTAEINKVLGTMFIFPYSGRISSRFGDRNDPFTGVERFHNGLDIVGPMDSPIKAVMGGKVSLVGTNATYGRYIILTHPGTGYQTMYAHLDKILVARGETVAQGERIGLMGNTGHVTGTHLHFSLFKNNEPVDPLRFLK